MVILFQSAVVIPSLLSSLDVGFCVDSSAKPLSGWCCRYEAALVGRVETDFPNELLLVTLPSAIGLMACHLSQCRFHLRVMSKDVLM